MEKNGRRVVIMVAQTIEVKNGRSIQKLAVMRRPMKRTASTVPVMSRAAGVPLPVIVFTSSGLAPANSNRAYFTRGIFMASS